MASSTDLLCSPGFDRVLSGRPLCHPRPVSWPPREHAGVSWWQQRNVNVPMNQTLVASSPSMSTHSRPAPTCVASSTPLTSRARELFIRAKNFTSFHNQTRVQKTNGGCFFTTTKLQWSDFCGLLSLWLHNFFEVGVSLKTVHVGGDHVVAEGVVSL